MSVMERFLSAYGIVGIASLLLGAGIIEEIVYSFFPSDRGASISSVPGAGEIMEEKI